MVVIGATGAVFMLAAVVMISVVSLICYVKTSHVSAAVMFISSIVAIATEFARELCPLLWNKSAQPGTIAGQFFFAIQTLAAITGISMFVFAVAFWRLLRHVRPQDEVQ